MTDDFAPKETQAERDGRFAEARSPVRTYISKTVTRPGQPGVPARYIHKVFDPETSSELELVTEGTEWLVHSSPQGRSQVKLLVSREAGHVSEIWLQRIVYAGDVPRATNVFNLRGDSGSRPIPASIISTHRSAAGRPTMRLPCGRSGRAPRDDRWLTPRAIQPTPPEQARAQLIYGLSRDRRLRGDRVPQ